MDKVVGHYGKATDGFENTRFAKIKTAHVGARSHSEFLTRAAVMKHLQISLNRNRIRKMCTSPVVKEGKRGFPY